MAGCLVLALRRYIQNFNIDSGYFHNVTLDAWAGQRSGEDPAIKPLARRSFSAPASLDSVVPEISSMLLPCRRWTPGRAGTNRKIASLQGHPDPFCPWLVLPSRCSGLRRTV